ncbi:hypothetical protein GEMRC1_003182 [Eukaryota sp. GEM-RC1]
MSSSEQEHYSSDYVTDEELAMAEIDDMFRGHSSSDDDESLDTISFAPTQSDLKSAGLSINDLLKPIDDSSAAISSLKQNLSTVISAPEPLPIAKRAQQRIERQEAYKSASHTVSEWTETVKRNRNAPSLSFPLNTTPLPQPSLRNLVTTKDDDDYGDVIGMNYDENLDDKAKLRSILHYASVKAKHQKKIKSKKYRALLKKDKPKEVEEDPEEVERMRAKERLTLRHKNYSKFIKRKLQRGETQDEDLNNALQIGQDLKKKYTMQGDESESDGFSSEEEVIGEEEEEPETGVYSMRFMKRAMEDKSEEGDEGQARDDFEISDSEGVVSASEGEGKETLMIEDDSEKESDDEGEVPLVNSVKVNQTFDFLKEEKSDGVPEKSKENTCQTRRQSSDRPSKKSKRKVCQFH